MTFVGWNVGFDLVLGTRFYKFRPLTQGPYQTRRAIDTLVTFSHSSFKYHRMTFVSYCLGFFTSTLLNWSSYGYSRQFFVVLFLNVTGWHSLNGLWVFVSDSRTLSNLSSYRYFPHSITVLLLRTISWHSLNALHDSTVRATDSTTLLNLNKFKTTLFTYIHSSLKFYQMTFFEHATSLQVRTPNSQTLSNTSSYSNFHILS